MKQIALAVALVATLLTAAAQAQPAGDVRILVLSNRADVISGGDALVEVVLPAGADPEGVTVDVDGRDVTAAFAVRGDGRFTGRVTGLALGRNLLTATLADGSGAFIPITNHPPGGPLIAGPQIQPWTCAGDAQDAQCNREPTYEFLYQPADGGELQPYDPDSPPPDVGQTTTDNGATVPFIVRVETGVVTRDEYRIAVLYDPSQPFEPWAPQPGFNHKLVIFHGASCDTSYAMGSAPDVLNSTALGRGFVTMSHALDDAGHNCNIATQAESLIMTKERVVEQYGELRYTIGSGCSGGSLVQQQLANSYPGLYQGITPACSFPDAWSSANQYLDYDLLRAYFEDPSRWAPGVLWEPLQQGLVYGHPNAVNAVTFTEAIPAGGDPSRECPGLEPEQVYDPATNPEGVRCTLQDYMESVFGEDPTTGFARIAADNTGVQYGVQPLLEGLLPVSQFVDLNAALGGWDRDYEVMEQRYAADPFALETVYRSGANNTASNMDTVAIIDFRGPDPGVFHDVYRTYALRERLIREHGTADNQVIWRGSVPILGDPTFVDASILAMDEWLAAVEADTRDVPLAQKIIEDRPGTLADRCTSAPGQDTPAAYCDGIVQAYTTPRIEAGAPTTDDVMKCALVPIEEFDYGNVTFSEDQLARLRTAFPSGVCDYSLPAPGTVDTVPWLTFAHQPGGVPLGDPPVSTPFGPGEARFALERFGGADRIATAASVSAATYDTAETVVLARADNFADALAGAPLAVHLDAPLLLTGSDGLAAATAQEATRLGATRALLLGGEAALSSAVATDLEALGLVVERVAGPDRYATSAAIAARLGPRDEVFVASGDLFPDALAASALAAAINRPVLLVPAQAQAADSLPADVAARLTPDLVATIVGGAAAVGTGTEAAIGQRVHAVERIAGATRYATSAAVAQEALTRGVTPATTWLATGAAFPDGLVAGAAAGHDRGVLLLVDGSDLAGSPETAAFLRDHAAEVDELRLAGGTAAISAEVEAAVAALLAG